MKRGQLGFVIFAVSAATAAWGQEAPANVNDCTLLQDPVELRNCVLRFEGNRTPLPATVEAPRPAEPPVAVGDGPAVGGIVPAPNPSVPATSPSAAARRAPATRGNVAAQPQPGSSPPATPRRPSRDTETSIEQIQVPR